MNRLAAIADVLARRAPAASGLQHALRHSHFAGRHDCILPELHATLYRATSRVNAGKETLAENRDVVVATDCDLAAEFRKVAPTR